MNPVTYKTDGDYSNLLRGITHELGHILGLADYLCGLTGSLDVLEPGTEALMNSWTIVGTRPGDPPSCDVPDGSPSELDKLDYRTVYLPAMVTSVTGEAEH